MTYYIAFSTLLLLAPSIWLMIITFRGCMRLPFWLVNALAVIIIGLCILTSAYIQASANRYEDWLFLYSVFYMLVFSVICFGVTKLPAYCDSGCGTYISFYDMVNEQGFAPYNT